MLLNLKDGSLSAEPAWHLPEFDGDAPIAPTAGDSKYLLLPDALWEQAMESGRDPARTALLVLPDSDLQALAGAIEGATVVGIHFPAFNDGRGFSHARLLRQQNYAGTLMAVGNFLPDQVSFLLRCGVDCALFADADRAAQGQARLEPFTRLYQVELGTEKN